jgi:RimJ/RimL family protein N-acetyltransferase
VSIACKSKGIRRKGLLGNIESMSDKNNFKIRRINESDREWIASILSNPLMTRFLPFEPMTADQSEERLQSYLMLNQQEAPQGVFLLEDSNQRAGYAFIRPFAWEPEIDELEIGYLIDPHFWGRSVGSTLANYLMSKVPSKTKIVALIEEQNLPSQKIIQKLGFKKLQSSKTYPGYWVWSYSN